MTGAELRARRKALGLSHGQLALRLGVASNTVARWERNELTIGQPKMVKMSLDQIEREVRPVTRTYAVIQPLRGTYDPYTQGTIISRHRTPEAAERHIAAANTALRREYPSHHEHSYRDWAVCYSDDGGRTWSIASA